MSRDVRMSAVGSTPARNASWALCPALCAWLLCACAGAPSRVGLAAFRGAIDSLPEAWREEPIVILVDSVDIRFAAAPGGNRVLRRQVTWHYVNRRNPSLMQDIVVGDFRSIETQPQIRVTVLYPDGGTWSSDPLTVQRMRWSEQHIHSSERYLSSVRLPRYVEGMLIRTDVTRAYFRPEFLKSEILRDNHPMLSKTVTLSLPAGTGIGYGLLNPEGLALDSARGRGEGREFLTARAARLPKLEARTMPGDPEAWYAAIHFSLPAKGDRSLTWSELGDAYLEDIRKAFEATPELETLAAGLPRAQPDSLARRVYSLLRERIRYHADLGILHSFVPRRAGEVLAKGYGDCKEMATLMTQILRMKGVAKVGVALVSTPGHVQVHGDFPSMGGFNHMIVYAEDGKGGIRFYDPTVKHGDPADSYYELVDRTALVLRDGASSLVAVPMGPGFRNRVETRSAIRGAKGRWVLAGSIRLEGQCAFSLLPTLRSAVEEEKSPLLKAWLKELFAVEAGTVRLVSATDRAIEIAYEAPFNANYLAMDKGGLLLAWPSLFGGDVRYSSIQSEGPRQIRKFEQVDTWEVPPGFEDLEKHDLDHAIGRGNWSREGGLFRRTFAAGPALVPASQRETLTDYVKLRNRFQKATLWQR